MKSNKTIIIYKSLTNTQGKDLIDKSLYHKLHDLLYPSMANKTSQHILGTSANLLGFCLIVISSLHVAEKTQNSLVDEFASLIALILAGSCILSFASIRTGNIQKERILERIADLFFLAALVGIFVIILYVVLKLWNN